MPEFPAPSVRFHLLGVPGKSGTYYYLTHSRREGKRVHNDYLIKFGRLTPDQVANVRAWVEALRTSPWTTPLNPADLSQLEFEENLPGFRHGIVALGHALWKQHGFPTILAQAFAGVKNKGFHTRMAEVMVLNRLDHPDSKLGIAKEWYPQTTLPYLLGEEAIDEDDLYATLDVLDERRDPVEKLVYERIVKPLDGASGVIMKDLTSTYFEGKGVGGTLLDKGYSRDRVRGSLQVNWSIVLTPRGFPVTLEVYRGNTKDQATVVPTLERLQKVFGLKEGTFVGDRGMLSEKNLAAVHAAGFHYIVAETLWNEKETLAEAQKNPREPLALSDPSPRGKGRQTQLDSEGPPPETAPEESWCEVVGEDGRRHIVVFSKEKQEGELASLKERLEAGKEIEKWAQAGVQRGEWEETNHHQLVKSVTRKLVKEKADLLYDVEWDENTVGGLNLKLDTGRKAWEEAKAGWWMLTTDTELPGPEVVRSYKVLAVVERAFRTIKGPIRVRPMRHRLDRRIRAHLYVCLLSYLLERWVEVKVRAKGEEEFWAHVTAERVLDSLREGSVQEVGIRGTNIRRWKLARFSPEGEVMLERMGLKGEVMKVPPMPTVLATA